VISSGVFKSVSDQLKEVTSYRGWSTRLEIWVEMDSKPSRF